MMTFGVFVFSQVSGLFWCCAAPLLLFPAMNKNTASGVAWVKPSEPSFLKKFKSDVGYKEGPTTDTKVGVTGFATGPLIS